jgi:predicted nucleic acid-binding protein
MPTKNARYIYWDACVFIDHYARTPGRAEEIKRVWADLVDEDKDNRIVTCTLAIAEVAYSQEERARNVLDAQTTVSLDAMWNDPSILLVEVPQFLMTKARDLIRRCKAHGMSLRPQENWVLKPADAVHLAAAMWVNEEINPIQEFNTYDSHLFKYAPLVGFPIKEPFLDKPQQTKFLDVLDNSPR